MRAPLVTEAALALGLVSLVGAVPAVEAAHGYEYYVVGDPADVVTPTSGLLVLQGGGTDVDENLDRDFLALPRLGGLITDQHLQERDRMGRTVAFLARLVHDGWTSQGRAIAADRETALVIDAETRRAEVLGNPGHPTPFVYFLRTPGPPEVCLPRTPRNVEVHRVGPDGTFDLEKWRGTGGISYTLSAEAGVLTSSRSEVY